MAFSTIRIRNIFVLDISPVGGVTTLRLEIPSVDDEDIRPDWSDPMDISSGTWANNIRKEEISIRCCLFRRILNETIFLPLFKIIPIVFCVLTSKFGWGLLTMRSGSTDAGSVECSCSFSSKIRFRAVGDVPGKSRVGESNGSSL